MWTKIDRKFVQKAKNWLDMIDKITHTIMKNCEGMTEPGWSNYTWDLKEKWGKNRIWLMKLKLICGPKVQKLENVEFSGEKVYQKRGGTRTGTHRKGRDRVSAGEYDFEPRMITLTFQFENMWKKAGIWLIKLILRFRLDQTTATHELTN